MYPVKYIAFILTTFVLTSDLAAQETANRHEVSSAYHFGFIIAHRNDIRAIAKGYTRAAEITYSRRFNGEYAWEQKYAFPYAGLSFFVLDFGNPEQIGTGFALLSFYDFPLNRGKRLELSFKIGIGPGYLTKRFDIYDNYRNYGISTHLNGFAHGNLRVKYHFKNLQANIGLGIFHFSNASFRKPNLGINIPIVNAGIGYSFREETRYPGKEKSAYSDYKKWYNDLIIGYGSKEKNPIGGVNHSVYTLHYDGGRQISFKSRVGVGADFFYNTALSGETDFRGDTILTPSGIAQGGLHVFYAIQVSKATIFLHWGRYLYSKYHSDGLIYNRAGLRYEISRHFLLNLSMKTHLAIADHVEYGIGYRF